MISILITWVASAVALVVTAMVLPGFEVRNGFMGAIKVALILGLLTAVLGKLLFGLLVVVTLGIGFLLKPLTTWLVSTLLLIATDKLSTTLTIRGGFMIAAIGALAIAVVSTVVERAAMALL